MFDQLFDSFRKTSESALQAQQDLVQRWMSAWPQNAGSQGDGSNAQKRWLESMTELLNMHRALLDSTYKSGIEVISSAFRVAEARSPEDYRRLMEELWRKLSETIKSQSDLQLRELQSASDRWMNQARNNATTAS